MTRILLAHPSAFGSGELKSEYNQEIPQSHTADQPMTPRGRATEYLKVIRHQEDNLSKVTSSLFLVKMIAKLERTQSNA